MEQLLKKNRESREWDDDLRGARANKEDRKGFIRKFYGILSVQLFLTTAAITAVKTVPGCNEAM